MRSAPICIPGGRTWYFPLVDFNKCEKYASFWKAYQIWSIWMNLNSKKNHRSVISFSHRNAFLSRFNNDKKIRKFNIFPFFNNTKKVGNTECAEKMCYLRLFCVWIDRFVSERGRAREVTVCNCNCNNVCATTWNANINTNEKKRTVLHIPPLEFFKRIKAEIGKISMWTMHRCMYVENFFYHIFHSHEEDASFQLMYHMNGNSIEH